DSCMKLNKFNVILLSIAAVFLALTAVWCFWDEYAAPETAAIQETPGWQAWKKNVPGSENPQALEAYDPKMPEEKRPGILIRTDSSKQSLLLKHRYANEIYLYD